MTRPALHFHDEGPRDAPAVLLLHALCTHSELWAPQRVVWKDRLRLISVDLPGHGKSPVLPHARTLDGIADEIVAVLDHLNLPQVAVVGLSLGGMLAQVLALRHSARVRSLVVAHAGARTDAAVRAIWDQRIEQFKSGSTADWCQSTLQRWFPRDFAERSPATLSWVGGLIRATQAEGYVNAIRAIQGLDTLDQLSAIQVPALVVAGQADAAVPPAVAQMLAERLPNARLQLLEDVGHLGNVQAPVLFTEVVGRFLAQALPPAEPVTP